MEKQRTQREWYNDVIRLARGEEIADPAGLIAFAEGRIEALDKKVANRKPSKEKVEADEALKAQIFEVLSAEGKTVTEIVNAVDVEGLSTSKATAILKKMVADGTVENVKDKKKSLYRLV